MVGLGMGCGGPLHTTGSQAGRTVVREELMNGARGCPGGTRHTTASQLHLLLTTFYYYSGDEMNLMRDISIFPR